MAVLPQRGRGKFQCQRYRKDNQERDRHRDYPLSSNLSVAIVTIVVECSKEEEYTVINGYIRHGYDEDEVIWTKVRYRTPR